MRGSALLYRPAAPALERVIWTRLDVAADSRSQADVRTMTRKRRTPFPSI
jgi:hypothetical protein